MSDRAVPTVSAVVPTYQREATIATTIARLLAEPDLLEIIVVDDGSTDGTGEVLRAAAAADPRVRPVTTTNGGANRARLAGSQAARGDVVLLLDDDVRLCPGAVRGHAGHHVGTARLVVVGYMPVDRGSPTRDTYPRDIYAREYEKHCGGWEADPESVLASLWSGNISLRREDHLSAGMLLAGSSVRGYHEDLDLGLSCVRAGLRGTFDRGLRARHLFERSPEGFLRDARSSGQNLAALHDRHSDMLGSLDRDFGRGLPAPARWLVNSSALVPGPRLLMTWAIGVFGMLHMFRLQRLAAGMAWRQEQLRAVIELTAGKVD
jgi:glycosyltransferase involved in cell wall biosynthesis